MRKKKGTIGGISLNNIMLRIIYILNLLLFSLNPVLAEDFGIIEQTIAVSFKPTSTYALVAQKLSASNWRLIKRIHGTIVANPEDEGTLDVAVVVPQEVFSEEDQELYYSFFLISVDGEIAATEVKAITKEQLLNSFIPQEQLSLEIKQFEQQLPILKTKNVISQNKLNQTKEKVSKIAEVDDLIDLKSELASLKEGDSNAASEVEVLKNLYADNVYKPDSPEDLQMRMDLEKQLKEIIKSSTFQKKSTSNSPAEIISNFHKKIELAKSISYNNPEILAKEVLSLRRKRLELEAQLSSTGTTESNKDF